ncbi:MAG: hypothetical protein E7399_01195 [Ruminococcaceae bacterium]|nr:hypothetical protein [Oscillospiraceae bacterium]
MKYTMKATSEYGVCEISESHISFTADKTSEQAFFDVEITFSDWEEDCYVMMPACAYNGNRLQRVARGYPPMYFPKESGVHCEPLMTDVPAFNPDGSGSIQVTTGDMATPCAGIFYRQSKQGFLLFTHQEVKGKNLGFTLEKGKIQISYPANRTDLYRFCRPHDTSGDRGIFVTAGEQICSPYQIASFDCADIFEFYKYYFQLRKSVLQDKRAEFGYTKELWDLLEQHFNEANFSGEYYAEASKIWQCGWVGGGMSTYPLLKYGTDLSRERAVQTLDYMTRHQAKSGFYYGIIKNGAIMDDSFCTSGMEQLHLLRKSADALYFLFKNFTAVSPKQSWIDSAK